ncbi:hypothetical protein [Kordia jejudonensis]|uniref:hypothetical protein n=1 Tax=Kordia jejudonensis TaxID=1348245 RepID=UPI000699D431|nr:hypothetical protein [Kordia jejudonensis]
MFQFKNIIKGNYLQYVRSYSFLITVALSVYIAFSFVPSPEANYTTIRLGSFTGDYNTAWIGFVTAIMSSTILSLVGFFLINGSIRRDIETRIGHIIGTTRISNTAYIITKLLSNFLILFSILVIVGIVSVILSFLYGNGQRFQLSDFVLPYTIITIPTLFVVASFSLLLEILLPKKTILQYGIFLVGFFMILFASSPEKQGLFDVFGMQYPTAVVSNQIQAMHVGENTELAIGFISGGRNIDKVVTVESISFTTAYMLNRLFWVGFAFLLAIASSLFFHRFNIKERLTTQLKPKQKTNGKSADFQLGNITETPEFSSQLSPLIGAEILMLVRKSPKWLWGISFGLMVAMIFVPITFAHHYMLPLLWFLQVGVWSDLVTKDIAFRTHYFTASSYQPVQRLFISRIIAGVFIALFIAAPLLVRYIVELDFHTLLNIVLGALFIILLSVFFGTLTKSKKLFEIVFFFLIYSNINLVSVTDYFGAVHTSFSYTGIMAVLTIGLFTGSYFLKKLSYDY